jgi:transposase InsO family protein
LEGGPVENVAGPLNRIGKPIGVAPPFQMTVKNVCKTCNNGWMESLEQVAQRVLTPLILGEPGRIHQTDQGAVAAWAQKTALVAMLMSSAEDREQGYGLPPSEYELLYQLRDHKTPLPASMFWIGRYTGELKLGSVWVTPLSLTVDGLPEPDKPHAYAMTIALGALLIHGIRFTSQSFYVDIATERVFEQLWFLPVCRRRRHHAKNHVYAIIATATGELLETRDFPTTSAGINGPSPGLRAAPALPCG